MTAPPCRCLIVDDEPLAIERLQILCAGIKDLHLVGTAADGESALRLIEALGPELVFLDIAMPGMDGIALATRLAALQQRPVVIFVTAFDQFAVSAFEVAAVDYLLKPISAERLGRAVERARGALRQPAAQQVGQSPPWVNEFWVPHRSEIIRIAAGDIELVEAERDYMRLHVGSRSFLLHQTISELEQKLDPARFIRLHRSTIVRRDCIAGFKYDAGGNWLAHLGDGRTIRIGRTYLAAARAIAGR